MFIKLDEFDEFDRITHAWIGFNYSLTQAQETFKCLAAKQMIWGQVSEFFL